MGPRTAREGRSAHARSGCRVGEDAPCNSCGRAVLHREVGERCGISDGGREEATCQMTRRSRAVAEDNDEGREGT